MRILCLGHSHISVAYRAYQIGKQQRKYNELNWAFLELGLLEVDNLGIDITNLSIYSKLLEAIEKAIEQLGGKPDCVFTWVGGSYQHDLGLFNQPIPFDIILPGEEDLEINPKAVILPHAQIRDLMRQESAWKFSLLKALRAHFNCPMFHHQAVAPIKSNDYIINNASPAFQLLVAKHGVSPAPLRYKLWRIHSQNYAQTCDAYGVKFLSMPPETIENGFLRPEFRGDDGIHANNAYGHALISQILREVTVISNNKSHMQIGA